MAKSRISNLPMCTRCGSTKNLHHHHLLNGPNRKKSDEDGLWIYLCEECHEYVHNHKQVLLSYKEMGQKVYEREIGTREDFMKRYRRNYL